MLLHLLRYWTLKINSSNRNDRSNTTAHLPLTRTTRSLNCTPSWKLRLVLTICWNMKQETDQKFSTVQSVLRGARPRPRLFQPAIARASLPLGRGCAMAQELEDSRAASFDHHSASRSTGHHGMSNHLRGHSRRDLLVLLFYPR